MLWRPMVLRGIVLLLALGAVVWMRDLLRPVRVPAPIPESESQPRSLFEFHSATCPQCGGPMLNPDGAENTLCEKGFELLQADLRKEQK